MTMESSYMESSTSESIIYNEYKLALKFFMNKDFEKSYPIIKKLYAVSRDSTAKGHLDESVFIKICTLYNTEVGLALNPKETFGKESLAEDERAVLIQDLKNDRVLGDLERFYGAARKIPSELLNSMFLVYYTCSDVLTTEFVAQKFKTMYQKLDYKDRNAKDEYLNRWLHMFVFNVLPDADDFALAKKIIRENPILDKEAFYEKLRDVEAAKTAEKQNKEKAEKELKKKEEARIAEERRRQQKEIEERNLKFRSLKQIKQEHEASTSGRSPPVSGSNGLTVEYLRARLLHILQIMKSSFQEKSPVYLAAFVGLFLLARFLKVRKVNLKDKIRETVKMALKVTYL